MAQRTTELNARRSESPGSTVDWETLAAYGIAHPRFAICSALTAALEFWRSGRARTVCLKGITSGHKTGLGLVALNLESKGELTDAWARLAALSEELGLGPALLVQEQVRPGMELILGGRRDPVFGPAVMLGLGGTLTEALQKSRARLAPLTEAEAAEMAAEVTGASDPRVAQVVLATSRLLLDHEDIEEMDLNPVILTEEGPVAVDLRVIAAAPGTERKVRSPGEVVFGADLAIRRMLAPSAVALIGASTDLEKPGGRVLHYLRERGLTDRVHLVNPRIAQIGDRPTVAAVADLPLTFTRALDYPLPLAGSVSYVTQSGALGGSLLIRSWAHRLGTARFVCVGNQTDLTIPDYLRFLAKDPITRTVGLFVEGLDDGRDFRQAARAVTAAGKGRCV